MFLDQLLKTTILFISFALFITSCGQQQHTTPGVTSSTPVLVDHAPQMFTDRCGNCHHLNENTAAPMLTEVYARWQNDTAKVISFIKNPEKVIRESAKDAYPTKLFKKWYQANMPAFGWLSDSEIVVMLNYGNMGGK